ncbi:MAG: CHAT domain-containing protein, partial [Candidatus Eremiobacteraeota bacterium]|nr:CHAT domain-containing protein [Candidatus Eremiobacteraeota bacterium]
MPVDEPDASAKSLEQLLASLGEPRRTGLLTERIRECDRALVLFARLAASDPRRGYVELELGQCLAIVARSGDPVAASRALAAFGRGLRLVSPDVGRGLWLQLMLERGAAYLELGGTDRDERSEEALAIFHRVVQTASPQAEASAWATAQVNLAYAYLHRGRGDRADNLWRATVSANVALKNVYDPVHHRVARARTLMILGSAQRQSIRGRPSRNLEDAISSHSEALGLFSRETEPSDWAQAASNLGNDYADRIAGERAENLEQAIIAFGHALDVFRSTDPIAWARTMTNLAPTFLARLHGDRSQNIEEAIAICDGVIDAIGDKVPHVRAMASFHRAAALTERIAGDRSQNVEDAIVAYEALLTGAFAPGSYPYLRAATQVRLGEAYDARRAGERTQNVRRAIDSIELALRIYTREAFPLDWARATATLARLQLSSAGSAPGETVARALDAYRAALDTFVSAGVSADILRTARGLGDAFAERERFTESLVPYRYALEAAEELYRGALSRTGKDVELEASSGLQHRAAYAFARSGDAGFAVVILERNRARWIEEALERDRVELDRLRLERPQLYAAYRGAASRIRALETSELSNATRDERLPLGIDRAWADEMMEAKRALSAASSQINATAGFEGTFRFPTFEDVAAAVRPERPLVYLTANALGGLALVLRHADGGDVEIEVVRLERFTTAWLEELTSAPGENAAYGAWLGTLSDPARSREDLLATIDGIAQRLWEPLLAPLLERLEAGGAARACLIPCGPLAMLPLHAAWAPHETTRTYALDRVSLSYTSSARALLKAERLAREAPFPQPDGSEATRLLAVAEPWPVRAEPLDNAESEVEAVASTFRSSQILRREAATHAAILAALPAFDVAHFSCHGFSNLAEPLRSGIVMANDELLTVADLFALDLRRARLIALSACETATIGADLPDETVSLAEAFVRAGFAGVVASLWPVADRATAMLMARFY